ncbi:MAG: hypothetical protein KGN40_07175 [Burkholderiales bacterium]|nr:hypothetical protein [Burkholderiales bacterium]
MGKGLSHLTRASGRGANSSIVIPSQPGTNSSNVIPAQPGTNSSNVIPAQPGTNSSIVIPAQAGIQKIYQKATKPVESAYIRNLYKQMNLVSLGI